MAGEAAPAARSSLLERLGVTLLVLAALVPRLRDVARPFDRGLEGRQGARAVLAALNYERLGTLAAGGYPVLNLDLGDRADAQGRAWDHPQRWLVRDGEPPLAALVAWKSIDALSPRDWDDLWQQGRAPNGVELPARLPFALAHVAALVALWWALRQGLGPGAAMIGLALAATTPVLALNATLAGSENPALLFALLGVGGYARWTRSRTRRDAWLTAGAFALGGCVSWAPLCFAGALAVHAAIAPGFARTWRPVLGALAACAMPLAAHVLWARHVAAGLGRAPGAVFGRAQDPSSLPLASLPTVSESTGPLTLPLVLVALVGLALALRRLRTGAHDVVWPLALGGAACVLALGGPAVLMFAAPGVIAFAALALDACAPKLAKLRAGIAPLVVLASTLGLFGLQRINAQRYELRGSDPSESSSGAPAPALPLPDMTGKEIAALVPPGALALHPSTLDLGPAVAVYAWRSLRPLASADEPSAEAIAASAGLDRAPRWFVLPNDAPQAARAQCDELRASLVGLREPDARGERWLAWRLR